MKDRNKIPPPEYKRLIMKSKRLQLEIESDRQKTETPQTQVQQNKY